MSTQWNFFRQDTVTYTIENVPNAQVRSLEVSNVTSSLQWRLWWENLGNRAQFEQLLENGAFTIVMITAVKPHVECDIWKDLMAFFVGSQNRNVAFYYADTQKCVVTSVTTQSVFQVGQELKLVWSRLTARK